MSKLKLNITMSLDGYVAGPDESTQHPLGIGGEQLHDWLVPLNAFRESHGEEGGEVNASTPFAGDILAGAGETITADEFPRGGTLTVQRDTCLGIRHPTPDPSCTRSATWSPLTP
jgi:hypothetical protein